MTMAVADKLRDILKGPASISQLEQALRHLAKWRAQMISNSIVPKSGASVLSGPFAGMDFSIRGVEGARSARLIGAYEASLHPVIEEIVRRGYALVIDVGAAEGYYAVGLARRMPGTRVWARDEDPRAQVLCRALAEVNGVSERVEIGGRMDHADFDVCTTAPTLVLCDIEGAESDLLDPVRAPGLLAADILLEAHDCITPGLSQLLTDRFAATHQVTQIGRHIDDSGLPVWMEALSDLDRLIALWEWRTGPTPWLWMVKK